MSHHYSLHAGTDYRRHRQLGVQLDTLSQHVPMVNQPPT